MFCFVGEVEWCVMERLCLMFIIIVYLVFSGLFISLLISSINNSGNFMYLSLYKLTARLTSFAILWNADYIYVVFSTGSIATNSMV